MHPHKPFIEKIDYKTAWQECVTSIESKARDIKTAENTKKACLMRSCIHYVLCFDH